MGKPTRAVARTQVIAVRRLAVAVSPCVPASSPGKRLPHAPPSGATGGALWPLDPPNQRHVPVVAANQPRYATRSLLVAGKRWSATKRRSVPTVNGRSANSWCASHKPRPRLAAASLTGQKARAQFSAPLMLRKRCAFQSGKNAPQKVYLVTRVPLHQPHVHHQPVVAPQDFAMSRIEANAQSSST